MPESFDLDADESFEPYMELVDEGGVPIFGVRAVMYLMDDGTTRTSWTKDGHAQVGSAMGLLESVKFEMYKSVNEDDE